jgi:hypothetical protein
VTVIWEDYCQEIRRKGEEAGRAKRFAKLRRWIKREGRSKLRYEFKRR